MNSPRLGIYRQTLFCQQVGKGAATPLPHFAYATDKTTETIGSVALVAAVATLKNEVPGLLNTFMQKNFANRRTAL